VPLDEEFRAIKSPAVQAGLLRFQPFWRIRQPVPDEYARSLPAAFASGHDQAVHWCKSVGQGTDSILGMDLSSHVLGVPTSDTDKSRAKLKRSSDDDHRWSNEEPDWNKAASLKR
jgi:hypothetical protein